MTLGEGVWHSCQECGVRVFGAFSEEGEEWHLLEHVEEAGKLDPPTEHPGLFGCIGTGSYLATSC